MVTTSISYSNTLMYPESHSLNVPTGIVDRIEDNQYVVIIFDSEDKQVVCEVEDLPEKARHSGAVIEADINGEDISNMNYLPDEERSNRERLNEKRDRLTEE